MFDSYAYSIVVKRVSTDDEAYRERRSFKATVIELPHVCAYGDSYPEVYESCVDAIETLYEMVQGNGEKFPVPIQEEEDSRARVIGAQKLTLTFTIDKKIELNYDEREEYRMLVLDAMLHYKGYVGLDDVHRIDAIQDFEGK